MQPWAEPTLEEQKAWDPISAGAVKETSFVSFLTIFLAYLTYILSK